MKESWRSTKPTQKRHPNPELPFRKLEFLDKTYWEKIFWNSSKTLVAGLDEAGRGAWAGPVVAAAVIFKPFTHLPEIDDSKKLDPKKRDFLFDVILHEAVTYGVGIVSSLMVDEINILEASLLAMREAVGKLSSVPECLLVDGNRGVGLSIPQKTLIGGDGICLSIGAASIVAKVTRDRLMVQMETTYPQFGFSKHKGYGTKAHQKELQQFGPLPEHRKSFRPIYEYMRMTTE